MAGFGTVPAQNTVDTAQLQQRLILQSQIKGSASWFYWIAGLSVVNSAIALSGSDWNFIAGLGITGVIDYIAKGAGSAGIVVAVMLDAFAAGMFVLFGVFANKRQSWAFIVGMTFYGFDALIWLMGQFWLGIAFHIYVLYRIWTGLRASNQLREIERNMPQTIVAG
jgi:hypothetical protein